MRDHSLRRRLVVSTLAAVLGFWLACGAAVYWTYRGLLRHRLEERLSAQVELLQSRLRFVPPPHRNPPPPRGDPNDPPDRSREGFSDAPPADANGRPPRPRQDGPSDPRNPRDPRQDEAPPPREEPGADDPGRPPRPDPVLEYSLPTDEQGVPTTGEALPAYFQIVRLPRYELVASSHPEGLIFSTQADLPDGAFEAVLPDNEPGLALRRTLQVHTNPPPGTHHPRVTVQVVVTVAQSISELQRDLAQLVQLLSAAGLAGALGVAAAVMLAVHLGLRPLRRLEAELTTIGEDTLSARLSTQAAPRELRPLVTNTNELLARLEAAFERERAFIANAAHELRTPLTALRTAVEVTLRQPRQPGQYVQSLTEQLTQLQNLQSLVEKLLLLARLERHAPPLRPEPTPLREVAASLWEQETLAAERADVKLYNTIPAEVTWPVDPDLLCLVLSNLLRNICHHAPPGAQATLSWRTTGKCPELVIANTGCNLRAQDVAKLFDRFWQGDLNRARTGLNAGLGLSIARRAAEVLGASLNVQLHAPDTIAFILALPGLEKS